MVGTCFFLVNAHKLIWLNFCCIVQCLAQIMFYCFEANKDVVSIFFELRVMFAMMKIFPTLENMT